MKQESNFNIPLLSGFSEISGRHKNVTAICNHALRMQSGAF